MTMREIIVSFQADYKSQMGARPSDTDIYKLISMIKYKTDNFKIWIDA